MSPRVRAGVVLVHEGQVALIERHRDGVMPYYVFPGGGVEPMEPPEGAAVREAREELGIHVALGPLLAEVRFRPRGADIAAEESLQLYYHAQWVSGTFGTGSGPEYADAAGVRAYVPRWVALLSLGDYDVRPRVVAEALARYGTTWPAGWVLRHRE